MHAQFINEVAYLVYLHAFTQHTEYTHILAFSWKLKVLSF